jgi:hypothetical protein
LGTSALFDTSADDTLTDTDGCDGSIVALAASLFFNGSADANTDTDSGVGLGCLAASLLLIGSAGEEILIEADNGDKTVAIGSAAEIFAEAESGGMIVATGTITDSKEETLTDAESGATEGFGTSLLLTGSTAEDTFADADSGDMALAVGIALFTTVGATAEAFTETEAGWGDAIGADSSREIAIGAGPDGLGASLLFTPADGAIASDRKGIANPVASGVAPFFTASADECMSNVNGAVLARILVSLLIASECLGSGIISKAVAEADGLIDADTTGRPVIAAALLLPDSE